MDSITRYPISDVLGADLTNRFTYHAPHGNQTERYATLRTGGLKLASLIVQCTPPNNREQNLALTYLEMALFEANASIARHELPPPDQKP